MNIVETIRQFVENECKKPESKYGYEPYQFHFIQVVEYSQKLQKELGGDLEIISLAAWLHDIGSIIYGRENHHITGAQLARKKLEELNYQEEKIKLIEQCILNHRGSQQKECKTIEEQIIAEADVLSSFDNIPGLFKAAFIYEKLSQGEAKISVKKKLKNKFKQLHFEKSKKLIEPKFRAAMLILEDLEL